MKEKSETTAFNKLVTAFRDMDQADFLEGVQASYGYDGNQVAWQRKAENAIEQLGTMARHGDDKSFKSLLYLGTRIAEILNKFATAASVSNPENVGDPFLKILQKGQKGTSLGGGLTGEDLEILASLPEENLSNIEEGLECEFPDSQNLNYFLPECLIQISLVRSAELPATPNHPVELYAPEFERLKPLMAKLASVRSEWEFMQMVIKEIACAKVWPVALSSVRELRGGQLKQLDTFKLGSNFPISVSCSGRRGESRGFTREGSTFFALQIYCALEEKRTYPDNPHQLESIRKSYTEYLNRKQEGITEVSYWNESNEWHAEAALLEPLACDQKSIDSWTQAGMKYIRSVTCYLSDHNQLPEFLRKKACKDTESPSTRRIETVTRNALKQGLKALVK